MSEELIRKFVDKYSSAMQALEEKDYIAARERYTELYNLYQDIHASKLEGFHKELAYEQLMKVYYGLQNPKPVFSYNYIMIGAAVFLVSIALLLKPQIVGLVVGQDRYVDELNMTFTATTFHNFTLSAAPKSFSITGTLKNAAARVYLVKGKNLYRVFDSKELKLTEGEFTNVCMESCGLKDFDTVQVQMLVEVEQGEITINKIAYDAKKPKNSPPSWTGKAEAFEVKGSTVINLSKYFTDADGDALVFLSTQAPGLQVTVSNEIVRIEPEPGINGTRELTFIASDFKDVTKVPVTILVS